LPPLREEDIEQATRQAEQKVIEDAKTDLGSRERKH